MRDDERRMTPEAEPSPAGETEERSSRVRRRTVVLAALALAGIVIGVIVYGYLDMPGSELIGVANKRFWDYLELLIVPVALLIGGYFLNRAQREREREAEQAHRGQVLESENQRAQDEALQAYLDQMGQMLTDKDRPLHRSPRSDRLRTVARARTLTVLSRLDGDRKARVLQFLYESTLIDATREHPIVDLTGADLSGANLRSSIILL